MPVSNAQACQLRYEMRKTVSLPPAGKKKAAVGVRGNDDQKASYATSLESCKEFQTGHDLTTGGYELGLQIAAGADGNVFKAVSFVAGREIEIAAKRIKVTNAVIQRHVVQEVTSVFHARKKYVEEVHDQTCFGHPCIVGYFDWFAGQGGLEREIWIAMELCNFAVSELIYSGSTMRTEYEKRLKVWQLKAASLGSSIDNDLTLYRFPERELVKVLFQMLSALSFLNRNGIFHRDVKCENVLWRAGEPEGCYKLADFGVAFCEAHADPCKRHDDCGTLWTMAPELLGKKSCITPGFSCDTWSLACVLFEMASFEKPFSSWDLTAYRNASAVSSDGFWVSVLGTSLGKGSLPSVSTPKTGTASTCFGAPPRVSRQASLPSLTSAGNKSDSPSAASLPPSPSSPSSPSSGKHGRTMLARSRTTGNSLVTSPTALSRQTSQEEPTSPTSPTGALTFDTTRAKKRNFLRKRSSLKWIYSEDLRRIICEDMLDDDTSSRPAPADMLACDKLHNLLASSSAGAWEPIEDVGRCAEATAAKGWRLRLQQIVVREADFRRFGHDFEMLRDCHVAPAQSSGDEATSAAVAVADATVVDAVPPAPPPAHLPRCASGADSSLRQLTPEAFLSVLAAKRKLNAVVSSNDHGLRQLASVEEKLE